jgi:ATP-dependent helicase HrpB
MAKVGVLKPLPIDPLLPEVVRALEKTGQIVLEAPPGAGKTTRVPGALAKAFPVGEIIVLEPRRLAARMAAQRVADELGEKVGETAGYQVRFEEVAGKNTRIRFVTEAILTRRLVRDPKLNGLVGNHEAHAPEGRIVIPARSCATSRDACVLFGGRCA